MEGGWERNAIFRDNMITCKKSIITLQPASTYINVLTFHHNGREHIYIRLRFGLFISTKVVDYAYL